MMEIQLQSSENMNTWGGVRVRDGELGRQVRAPWGQGCHQGSGLAILMEVEAVCELGGTPEDMHVLSLLSPGWGASLSLCYQSLL